MKTRIYFLDNLRTFLILLVVVLHSGLVYESVLENSWIVADPVKNNNIGLIRMYLDLFVMFCIFFISGYFVPASAQKQNSCNFVRSKFKRIMVPWFLAVFTLIPAYKFIFLYSRGLPQEEWFSYFHFFERAGSDLSSFANNPVQNWLWFLPVLFLFQLAYLAMYKSRILQVNISLKTAVVLTFVLGVIYGVTISTLGLSGWYHSFLLHFQRERLLVYFLAFLLGSLCYKLKVFERPTRNRKLYIVSNVVVTFSLGIFTAVALNTFFNLIDPQRQYYFISEFADRVLYYSSGLLSMLSLLHIFLYSFQTSLNKTNAVLSELSRNSYPVYILHMVVMGVIALTLTDLPIPAMLKFLILSIVTFVVSNMMIYTWRTTLQKQINMKTITTFVLVVLITGAAFRGYPEAINAPEIPAETQPQSQSLHAAVINNDLASVEMLIESGASVDEREPASGSSPLMTAALFGRTEIAQKLLDAGADIDYQNNDGSTALHTAAFFCHPKITKRLLAASADRSIRNKAGSTALESVLVPFEMVKPIYDYMQKIYEPLGLTIDQERIQKTRPEIAKLLTEE
ncbi:acyltransferase family protein [Maribellus sp. CM-23]|uniref:acyltransferase family protein n=1 Tax=Maribellus sp. CM-23 TaxID=2781026 RepID=UPI001F39D8C3|nr:acyltransferase family protein [Maribellus sp. CM-23]MCE4564824.1 acyltransferase family protein [Maribellus sp. CM-23]